MQKRKVEQMLESNTSSSDLYSPSETEVPVMDLNTWERGGFLSDTNSQVSIV